MKLVAVTINGITKFLWLCPDSDGKFRVPEYWVVKLWRLGRGEGYYAS